MNNDQQWKKSFQFLVTELVKFRRLKDVALKSRGNVTESKLQDLQDILSQIVTTDELKDISKEEQETYPMIFENWTDVPYWTERNRDNTVHVILWDQKTVDGINGETNREFSEESAWNTISDQLNTWLETA